MQDAGVDLPARAWMQLVGLGVIQDAVVAFVPTLQAVPDIVLAGPWLETHESIRKIVVLEIILRREIVRFGLAALANQFGVLLGLMHVMGDGSEVVEKLAEHVPAATLAHDIGAEEFIAN